MRKGLEWSKEIPGEKLYCSVVFLTFLDPSPFVGRSQILNVCHASGETLSAEAIPFFELITGSAAFTRIFKTWSSDVSVRFRWSRCQMKAQNMTNPAVLNLLSYDFIFIFIFIILEYVRNSSFQSQILWERRSNYVINLLGTFVVFYQSV